MQLQKSKTAGMTIVELLVVIAILSIFMGIAIPTVAKSFRSTAQAKKITARYPDAWRALNKVSNMIRRTLPAAVMSGNSFVGRNGSYDAGGISIPYDELSIPVSDTGYAHLGSAQRISFRLELTPEKEDSPRGLVQTRSALGAAADAGTKETLLRKAIGLDFRYLDDSTDPPEWLHEWPPNTDAGAARVPGSASGVDDTGENDRTPAPGVAVSQSVHLPKAVKITVFVLGEISPQPTSFTTVVNVPSR